MKNLIPQQLVFKSSRHTALYLITELYKTIEFRLEDYVKNEIETILTKLLSTESSEIKFSDHQENSDVVKFIKFYLEFNHIADRFHRIYLAKENHLIPKLVNDLKESKKNFSDKEFTDALDDIEMDLVLTAHPTEIFERKILKKYMQIHKNLKKLLVTKNFDSKSSITHERDSLLLSLWLSPDYSTKKPNPKDEAKLAQLIYQYSLWNGLPGFKKTFYKVLKSEKLPLQSNKNLFKFSSWMGGDRDGNPFVTSGMTRAVIKSFAKKSINLYLREFKRLKEDLSFNINIEGKVIEIEKAIHDFQTKITRIIEEDYDFQLIFKFEKEILKGLKGIYTALVNYDAKFLADQRLRNLIDRLESFGLLGISWDIRQESAYHDEIMDTVFGSIVDSIKYSELEFEQRNQWLVKNIRLIKKSFDDYLNRNSNSPLKNIDGSDNPAGEAVDFIKTIQLIQEMGKTVFPYYVISMTRADSDLILLQSIFKSHGIVSKVVPLFETLEDLENSPDIMESFFNLKSLKPDLEDSIVPIMLGYSDSAKTGSRLSSVWNLYLAQKKLVKIAKSHHLETRFFHGRGGSIGRGGGPVQHAISSCPPESLLHGFRMTIQGEVIFDRFGFSKIAVQSMMTYLLSLINYRFAKRKDPSYLESFESIFSEMSENSKVKYRDLISKDNFFDYFEAVTPVNFMSDLNIGSRPSKRNSGKKSYRAIPWIFGWTQNRCLLPAWYGAGTALNLSIEKHGLEKIKELYNSFYLFRSTLDLVYMTYLKIQMDIFKKYDDKLGQDFDHFKNINSEFLLLKENLLKIVDLKKINNVNLEEKLYGRLEILEYLHDLQIEKLSQSKSKNFSSEDKKQLLLSIQALASGMGNTG